MVERMPELFGAEVIDRSKAFFREYVHGHWKEEWRAYVGELAPPQQSSLSPSDEWDLFAYPKDSSPTKEKVPAQSSTTNAHPDARDTTETDMPLTHTAPSTPAGVPLGVTQAARTTTSAKTSIPTSSSKRSETTPGTQPAQKPATSNQAKPASEVTQTEVPIEQDPEHKTNENIEQQPPINQVKRSRQRQQKRRSADGPVADLTVGHFTVFVA